MTGVDFVNETLGNENLQAGNPERYRISNGLSETQLVSGLMRLNYGFDNRYLVTFTARADGSSKFGSGNKWAFFPSGALSWNIHNEKFLKDVEWVNTLKLRASYGISGNQGISPYQTLSRFGQHKYYYDGSWQMAIGPGYQSGYTGEGGIYAVWSGIANTNLKWETTAQFDVGLDVSLFGNRLNFTFDWYDKVTNDLLRERNIAPSSGYDRMWVNDGVIKNTGFEVTLDGIMFSNKDWKIGGTLVFTRNRNRVISLGNAIEAGLMTDKNTGMQYEYYGNSLGQFRGYTNILAIGQPMYAFYGYKVDGIVQSLEDGLTAGLTGSDAEPGEFRYVDIDGSGTVDENDRTLIGDPNPDFLASLSLDVKWRNLDASIFFNGVFGNDVINTQAFGQPSNNPLRWTPDNPTNKYPKLRDDRQTKFSDWWVEDGTFVRIQTVQLGYTFPLRKQVKFMDSIRLYVNVDNLFTFTKFKGYDPEVGANGIYSGGYPRLRRWTFGLDINF
jgi:TonB-linked SusC/RagA family outer membrane protein